MNGLISWTSAGCTEGKAEVIGHTRSRPCSVGALRLLHGLPSGHLLARQEEEAVRSAAGEDGGASSHEGHQVYGLVLL